MDKLKGKMGLLFTVVSMAFFAIILSLGLSAKTTYINPAMDFNLSINNSMFILWPGIFVGINTTTPSEVLTVIGNVSIGGTLDLRNFKITNIATPTADADAATKAYVDAAGCDLTAVKRKVSSLIGLPIFGGDGSDGNLSITIPTALSPGIRQYFDLNISSRLNSTEANSTAILIAVAGTLRIFTGGNISVNGQGHLGRGGIGENCLGKVSSDIVGVCITGAGGGGGSCGASGNAGSAGGGAGNFGGYGVPSGKEANASNATPTSGTKISLAELSKNFLLFPSIGENTTGIIGGAGGGGGNIGSIGGNGGGVIYIEANTINITDNVPSITADGANGTIGSQAGAGGGGGGLIWIRGINLIGVNSTTVTAIGGKGSGPGTGGCLTNYGGNGANGTVIIEKVI